MISYSESGPTLEAFYGVSTTHFESLDDVNVSPHLFREIEGLSTDEQFDLLNQLMREHTLASVDLNDEDVHDPLLPQRNVVKELLDKGIIDSVNDPNIGKYLISSQGFDSQQFLADIHEDSSINDLALSLNFLEKSIENQTLELKSVINDNFASFVSCKKSMDDVLAGFKSTKTAAQLERSKSKVYNPQKKLQRTETLSSDLEESLKNITMASSLRMRPIMDHKNKETKIAKLIEFIGKHKFFFDLPSNLVLYIEKGNQTQFVADYHRYIKEKDDVLSARNYRYSRLDSLSASERANVEVEHLIGNSALLKVFAEVDRIIAEYRRKIYKQLLLADPDSGTQFMSLVDQLHQLDNKDVLTDPIYDFLSAQLTSMKDDLDYQNNKFSAKFTTMQRKLSDYISLLSDHRENGSYVRYIADKYSNIADTFKTSPPENSNDRENTILEVFESSDNLDLSIVNETWLVVTNHIAYLQELFVKNLSKFVANYIHYSTQETNIDPKGKLRDRFLKLVLEACKQLKRLFNDGTTVDQVKSTPEGYTHFIPYYTNSLSTIFYLLDISRKVDGFLTKLGNFTSNVGNASKSPDTNKIIKQLRDTSAVIDQKILEAVCATWVNDCSQFYDLEDWEKVDKKPVHTKAMKILEYYELYMLVKVRRLIFDRIVPEDGVRITAAHPSKRTLMSVEFQFLRSLNVLLDSVMKRYTLEQQRFIQLNKLDEYNIEKELYKVLTMNNYDVLSKEIFEVLIGRFDTLFKNNLSGQHLKLFPDIEKAVLAILEDMLAKERDWIHDRVFRHFAKVVLRPTAKLQVDGFIYEVLMHFVKLNHVVLPLTGIEIFQTIAADLQAYFLNTFLAALRDMKENETFTGWSNLRLDIQFFSEIFHFSKDYQLDEHCEGLVNIVFSELDKVEKPNYTGEFYEEVLGKALRESLSAFTFSEN